ncbi:helix-turn-helix domain-containing protein [Amycolatopsis sp. H20-H5]|uniref:helix-turn-helix domain-containing protein n=1 Tax=Amycolatopsis sp. H20-H5 TaxID=3046309 RepID=UPI002DBD1722|nr:helix-turn-helix transcriptional regulator [Amycolatopsis sp. H20-H5]MEC3981130.1 helix-turn-helix transcriptional regulator [Amycolatopsis sp. H20-H5]
MFPPVRREQAVDGHQERPRLDTPAFEEVLRAPDRVFDDPGFLAFPVLFEEESHVVDDLDVFERARGFPAVLQLVGVIHRGRVRGGLRRGNVSLCTFRLTIRDHVVAGGESAVSERLGSTYRRRVLGRTLRRLREATGMSLDEAGRTVRISKPKLSRIENGQHPSYNDFMALLDRYGVITNDYPYYVRMYDRAKEKGWWHAFGVDDRGFVPVEAEASVIRTYELGFIPGILQSERYMRATYAGARVPFRGHSLENQVTVRLRRKRRLFEEPLLTVHAIIDESAMRRPRCDREQLEHLLELADLSNVVVQVVPLSAGSHSGLYSNFAVVSFPDPAEPDLAYVEYGFGSVEVERVEEVRAARLVFDHLAGLALDEQASVALIERMIAEM